MYKCLYCSKKLDKRNKLFCSNLCQGKNTRKKIVDKWLNNEISACSGKTFLIRPAIRNFLIEENEYKCSKCGWGEVNPTSKNVPLEIDHINGDASDGSFKNLRVLCPNCHSLTSTFRNLNPNRKIRNRRQVDQSGNGPAL
jgi:hypothetical protein